MPRPLIVDGRDRHIAPLLLVALSVITNADRLPAQVAQNAPVPTSATPAADAKPEPVPTFDSILKAWKARQERTKLVHVAWDTKVPRPSHAGEVPPKDADFRMLHTELWLDDEQRSRVDQGFSGSGYSRIKNGDTSILLKWRIGSSQPLIGIIWSANDWPREIGYELASEVNQLLASTSMRPIWNTFRPADFLKPPGDFRPVESTKVDGVRCLKFEWRTTGMSHRFSVDPARDSLVLSWDSWYGEANGSLFRNSIEYQEYPNNVWVPARWTSAIGDAHDPHFVGVSTLTACTLNQRFPPETFATTFPEGTVVIDRRTQEQYVIGENGVKTDILKVESPKSLKILEVLDADVDFKIEPQSFKDALEFVAARYSIEIRLDDHRAIDRTTEVECQAPGLTVRELLQKLMDQVGSPLELRVWNGALVIVSVKHKQ
jgi:hypothetical protein